MGTPGFRCSGNASPSLRGKALACLLPLQGEGPAPAKAGAGMGMGFAAGWKETHPHPNPPLEGEGFNAVTSARTRHHPAHSSSRRCDTAASRSEEHTSELQSLMRISYAVFCLKKKTLPPNRINTQNYILQAHIRQHN